MKIQHQHAIGPDGCSFTVSKDGVELDYGSGTEQYSWSEWCALTRKIASSYETLAPKKKPPLEAKPKRKRS